MKYLALLLLTGCTTQSLDDLYLERAACANAKLDCSDVDEAIELKEKFREWRKNAEMNCPKGYSGYCDYGMYGCGRRMSKKPIEYVCITQEQVRALMGW